MHAVDETEPFLYPALRQRLLDLGGNVDDLIAVFRVEPEVMGV